MLIKLIAMILFARSALSRNVPNFKDLDEDEQMLFRAAYSDDAPYSYPQDHATYNQPYPADYSNEIPVHKLDLLKDGMWALKAKMKELKAFNKALAANLLLTKLTVKELLEGLKVKKLHVEVDKPAYNYQPPSYQPQSPPHPQYSAATATPQYAPTYVHYGAPPTPHDPYHGAPPTPHDPYHGAPPTPHDPYHGAPPTPHDPYHEAPPTPHDPYYGQ